MTPSWRRKDVVDMSWSPGIAGVAFASGYEHLMILRLAVGLGVASTFTSAGGAGA